jgi:hypothetical protein
MFEGRRSHAPQKTRATPKAQEMEIRRFRKEKTALRAMHENAYEGRSRDLPHLLYRIIGRKHARGVPMRLIEIYFWNAVFWALYLPLSILLWIITEQGDILGILLIGFLNTIILTIYLSFQDECLFESWEPAIVHRTAPKQAHQSIKPTEVEHHATKEKDPSPEREPDTGIDTSGNTGGFSRELVRLRKARVRKEFEIKQDEGGGKPE